MSEYDIIGTQKCKCCGREEVFWERVEIPDDADLKEWKAQRKAEMGADTIYITTSTLNVPIPGS